MSIITSPAQVLGKFYITRTPKDFNVLKIAKWTGQHRSAVNRWADQKPLLFDTVAIGVLVQIIALRPGSMDEKRKDIQDLLDRIVFNEKIEKRRRADDRKAKERMEREAAAYTDEEE